MRQQCADVGHEWQIAGGPEPITQRSSRKHSNSSEQDVRTEKPAVRALPRAFVDALCPQLEGREHCTRQHQERQICRKGVVLLIGRNRKEDHHEAGVERQQPDAAAAKACRVALGMQITDPPPAGAPGAPYHQRQIEAPRQQPRDLSDPIHPSRLLVVVHRVALAEKAQHVLVDEVEVEEAVHVAERRMVADRIALVRITQPGENVPWRRDDEKKQDSSQQPHLAPAPPFAGERQPGGCRGEEEDRSDQSFGQRRDRE